MKYSILDISIFVCEVSRCRFAEGQGAQQSKGKCAFPFCQSVRQAASLRRRALGERTIPPPQRWYICAHPASGGEKNFEAAQNYGEKQGTVIRKYLQYYQKRFVVAVVRKWKTDGHVWQME